MSTPEYLDSSDGTPQRTGGRRTPWIVGGAVAAVALLGGGAWAAWSFFSTGPQPAEALPASTVAYASVDLDPSGGQKIEALRTLRKFPAFREDIGLGTDDDVRKWLFEKAQDSGTCPDLDYGDDVEPWLGDRMAVAAVDTGEDTPAPVLVLQVSDEDAAGAALAKIRDCGGEDLAWSMSDGWALLGETQDVVDEVAADAGDTPLSDDADFQHWTDEAGGDGIASFYVSPDAGGLLADQLDGAVTDELGGEMSGQVDDRLRDFGGMAATVRFSDGALELEVAADPGDAESAMDGSTAGDDVVATLPEDTAAAVGFGLTKGWLGDLVDADLMKQLEEESGLDLPDDVETLLGSSAALAVSGDMDPEAVLQSSDGSDVPVGLKVKGDADAISDVVDKMGGPFEVDVDEDMVAIGPDAGYRDELLQGGDLGDTDAFRHAVPDAGDAAALLFVDFDAGSWLDKLAADDQDVADNLAPLEAAGLSVAASDGTMHAVLRITTG